MAPFVSLRQMAQPFCGNITHKPGGRIVSRRWMKRADFRQQFISRAFNRIGEKSFRPRVLVLFDKTLDYPGTRDSRSTSPTSRRW